MIKYNDKLFDTVICDLDGVLTDTASLHNEAWKQMFDLFLQEYSQKHSIPFAPFDPAEEYLKYIDGRPRYEGASAFIASRGIDFPFGDPDDPPGKETICSLANKKNQLYQSLIETEGVKAFPDAVEKVKQWQTRGYKLAVISASKNCRKILNVANLNHFFEIIIDGNDAINWKLKGKPQPDVFIAAADKMGTKPADAVIIEDAVSGVQAGKYGGFGLVIGMARDNQNSSQLKENGAHIVVSTFWQIPDTDTKNPNG